MIIRAPQLLVLGLLVLRPSVAAIRAHLDRRVLIFGLLWWIASLAITVWIPARSSLYACLPSVGVVLIAAEFLAEAAADASTADDAPE